ncbi:MAG: 4Fe-4S binding protein [Deltaproteobacteria bacterium]|nr:4Fe-4S binding protein [Deltaproteobacteria bacterium]
MAVCHITDECIACGACLDECPKHCITEGAVYVVDQSLCDGCGNCADACPVDCCIIE